MKIIIIQGSSRSKGNTSKIVEIFRDGLKSDLIDLNLYEINHYNYEHKNSKDDFLNLLIKIVEYDIILFATPVYWYSMSGLMKTFFDRITDCLKIEKEIGRKLRGKYMGAISCGSDNVKTEGFFVPFRNSAEYLGMNYIGDLHTWIRIDQPVEEVQKLIAEFILKLEQELNSAFR